MGDAPWRLGAVRVQPWLGLRDVAYIDNVFGSADDPESDLTLTFGAGLKAYLPVGEKVVLAAHILPEYVWWRDNDQLSDWHYRYGAGGYVDNTGRYRSPATSDCCHAEDGPR